MVSAVTTTAQAGLAEVVRALTAISGAGAAMVRGPGQSGKSALLEQVCEHLHAAGRSVHASADIASAPAGSVVVLDDAHISAPDRIATMTELVERADVGVLIATQPRTRDAAMRDLTDAVAANGRVFDIRPLTASDIVAIGRDLGVAVAAPVAATIVDVSGGSNNGVLACIDAVRGRADTAAITVAASRWASGVVQSLEPDMLSALALTTVGGGLDPADVASAVEVDHDRALALVAAVRTCGLVAEPDLLLPVAAAPLRSALGERPYLMVQQRLFESQIEAGGLRTHTALALAETGVRDERLAEFLRAAADRADLFTAAKLYSAATLAGGRRTPSVRHSVAAAVSGDLDTATSLAERVLTAPDSATDELATAVAVLAAVSAHRGDLRRSAELFDWLGPERSGATSGLAVAVAMAVGDPTRAACFATATTNGPPTGAVAGATQLGAALMLGLTNPGPSTTAAVGRAAATLLPTESTCLVPGSASAVAALACLHAGELARADELLGRAIGGDRPGSISWYHHHLLSAWSAMLGGDDLRAKTTLDGICFEGIGARDALLAHALRVGLARRSGDHGALSTAWNAVGSVLHDITPDVFMVLPLGELWLGAIRMGEETSVAHCIEAIARILDALGDPAMWSSTFHWYGVQAAILSSRPADLVPHAGSLKSAAAAGDRYAAALAGGGAAWLRVLQGRPDAAECERAARVLGDIGLSWDGARLASEAALSVADTAEATALLHVARSLRQNAPRPAAGADDRTRAVALTEREVEVADLLVLGLTYREIGARLYISAKTVEHHVARIRRRVGAGSRSEMLSVLRTMGFGRTADPLHA